MAELVDALGLGSSEFIRAGSSPVLRIIRRCFESKPLFSQNTFLSEHVFCLSLVRFVAFAYVVSQK